MPFDFDRQNRFTNEIGRISALPAHERIDALLDYFVSTLNGMQEERVRTLRDQVLEQFSTCGASFETCVLIIELIDGHLALRALSRNRDVTGTRFNRSSP